jgi:hypothetical protein
VISARRKYSLSTLPYVQIEITPQPAVIEPVTTAELRRDAPSGRDPFRHASKGHRRPVNTSGVPAEVNEFTRSVCISSYSAGVHVEMQASTSAQQQRSAHPSITTDRLVCLT